MDNDLARLVRREQVLLLRQCTSNEKPTEGILYVILYREIEEKDRHGSERKAIGECKFVDPKKDPFIAPLIEKGLINYMANFEVRWAHEKPEGLELDGDVYSQYAPNYIHGAKILVHKKFEGKDAEWKFMPCL